MLVPKLTSLFEHKNLSLRINELSIVNFFLAHFFFDFEIFTFLVDRVAFTLMDYSEQLGVALLCCATETPLYRSEAPFVIMIGKGPGNLQVWFEVQL